MTAGVGHHDPEWAVGLPAIDRFYAAQMYLNTAPDRSESLDLYLSRARFLHVPAYMSGKIFLEELIDRGFVPSDATISETLAWIEEQHAPYHPS